MYKSGPVYKSGPWMGNNNNSIQIWAFRDGPWMGRDFEKYSWAWGILGAHGGRPNYQSIRLHLWPSFHISGLGGAMLQQAPPPTSFHCLTEDGGGRASWEAQKKPREGGGGFR